MVFASTFEHASSAFIFSSTSSDQICRASSEHYKKYRWRAASKFSLFIEKKRHLRHVDTAQPISAF